jgi:hypothetical protein
MPYGIYSLVALCSFLRGFKLAYVLHPVGNKGQFRIMGKRYVHGFMDGEAVSIKHFIMRELQLSYASI